VLEVGIVLQVRTPSALPHTWTLKWVYKELGSATEKVDGKVLSVTVKFVIGIRQEKISNVIFVRLVDDVASSYRLIDLGRLES
jgi:hypothetical protein